MRLRLNKDSLLYKKARDIYHYCQLTGINRSDYSTKERIVIIESDDWGSIRTPSKDALIAMERFDNAPVKDAFLRYDCLESKSDIDDLCAVLSDTKGGDGNSAVLTANFAMANADFDKIGITNEYHREIFTETYKKYYGDDSLLGIVKKYRDEKLFVPQLHCLEHLNVNRWMRDLRTGKKDTVFAMKNGMYGIDSSFCKANPFGYMDAFNYYTESEREDLAVNLKMASEWFEIIFGKKSESFTASCYVWDEYLENELKNLGILHVQTGARQFLPFFYSNGSMELKRVKHLMAEKNHKGIRYTVRNCAFEPSLSGNPEWSRRECFFQVENAFHNHVPAIISSHRLNYIGSIDEGNKMRNLEALDGLLKQIVCKYPDAVFLSSDVFGGRLNKETI